jgi:hypothetical protein
LRGRYCGGCAILTIEELARLEIEQVKRERETTEPDPDMWRWSPLEIWEFARMLEVARQLAADGLRRLRFAEAGSGIGTKLYLAQNKFDMSATGFEINEEYITQARKLDVCTNKWDLRKAHPPWRLYDIVYMARPFKDDDYEVQWEREVHDRMRDKAVLISAYAAVKPYSWPCYYRAPFRGVWMKTPRTGQYSQMIQRSATGSDPLVPEPGPR